MNNCTYLSRKLWWVVSVPQRQYSPSWRRKKKAIQVRSIMEMFLCVVPWETVSKAWVLLTVRGKTHAGGEYYLC